MKGTSFRKSLEEWLGPYNERNAEFAYMYKVGLGYGKGLDNGSDYETSNGFGHGYSTGTGHGDGNGGIRLYEYDYCIIPSGYGDGRAACNGYGDGSGGFDGGIGSGVGITEFGGHPVYIIDGTYTCIVSLHGNVAKGFVIKFNSITVPCYIAKVGDCFAHGDTAHEAFDNATEKSILNEPVEKRVNRIREMYPDPDEKIPNNALFVIHNLLTGSCEFGRRQFCEEHGIDVENGSMTMGEFISLTKSAYGGESIGILEDAYDL